MTILIICINTRHNNNMFNNNHMQYNRHLNNNNMHQYASLTICTATLIRIKDMRHDNKNEKASNMHHNINMHNNNNIHNIFILTIIRISINMQHKQ